MSGIPTIDRRKTRREATIGEIVEAAWALSREVGITGFSMRDLGTRVGMRAQSLYGYFTGKHALYDAMFASANRRLIEWFDAAPGAPAEDLRDALERMGRRYFEFCVADPVRYQLLFQRPVPDFVPSPGSYSLAIHAYEVGLAPLRSLGVSEADLDLATAVITGLVSQQLANDPGGDRWERLVDRAVAMLLRELSLIPNQPTKEAKH